MEQLRFLTPENIEQIRIDFGTPTFVYDEDTLRTNAKSVLNFPNAFGLYPRYAMKSAPTGAILRIFNSEGLGIDASSEFEVERAVRAGYGTESISMSTQEFPENFRYWVQDGVHVNLCSLNQIHKFGIWGKENLSDCVSIQEWGQEVPTVPMWAVLQAVLEYGKRTWRKPRNSVNTTI